MDRVIEDLQWLYKTLDIGGKTAEFYEAQKSIILDALVLLEKQIPKKIKQDIVNGKMARWCPNECEITYVTQYSSINYCPKCGQAIKWE